MKIKICFLFIFSCILIICAVNIFYDIYNVKQQDDIIDSLIEVGEITLPEDSDEFPKIDFEKLKEVNKDIVGWIIIEGTQVNYPIVKGSDNSYYLSHSYDKSYNVYGSIFMDYKANSHFNNLNTFLYGHYTSNGSMFGELKKYMDDSFHEEHPFFYIFTLEGNYKANVLSAYTDDALSNSYISDFHNINEYKQYLKNIIAKSRYKTNVDVDYSQDKLVTLYSCSHESGSKTERYFVHAVLNKITDN